MFESKWIVVATYNERENLARLLPLLRQAEPEASCVVVDDNSPDGSADFVEELARSEPKIHVLRRGGKLGYGTAILDGFRYALEHGAEAVLTLDADLSHDPLATPELFEALNDCDFVLGSRYKEGIRILNWSLGRLTLSLCANLYVRAILALPVHDATGGFRAYRREALESLLATPPCSTGYSFLVECLYLLLRQGYRVAETPIIYHERRVGQSKMSKSVVAEALWRPIYLRLKFLFSGSPASRRR